MNLYIHFYNVLHNKYGVYATIYLLPPVHLVLIHKLPKVSQTINLEENLKASGCCSAVSSSINSRVTNELLKMYSVTLRLTKEFSYYFCVTLRAQIMKNTLINIFFSSVKKIYKIKVERTGSDVRRSSKCVRNLCCGAIG